MDINAALKAVGLLEYQAVFADLDLDVHTLQRSSNEDWEYIQQHVNLSLGKLLRLRHYVRDLSGYTSYVKMSPTSPSSSSNSSSSSSSSNNNNSDDPAGQNFDQYTVVQRIGHGNFGSAYIVRETNGGVFVLKCISCMGNRKKLKNAEKEARMLAKLPPNDHLLTLCDFFRYRGRDFCVVLPLCKGGTLQDRLHTIDSADIPVILSGCIDALHALHTHSPPIIHRDVKPDNLFFRNCYVNSIVVGDMGLSRALWEHSYYESSFGHIQYMAPEITQNRAVTASDIWSLGVVLLCMIRRCTREDETIRVNLGTTSRKQVGAYLEETRGMFGITEPLWTLLEKMMRWKHTHRPSTRDLRQIPTKLPRI